MNEDNVISVKTDEPEISVKGMGAGEDSDLPVSDDDISAGVKECNNG